MQATLMVNHILLIMVDILFGEIVEVVVGAQFGGLSLLLNNIANGFLNIILLFNLKSNGQDAQEFQIIIMMGVQNGVMIDVWLKQPQFVHFFRYKVAQVVQNIQELAHYIMLPYYRVHHPPMFMMHTQCQAKYRRQLHLLHVLIRKPMAATRW